MKRFISLLTIYTFFFLFGCTKGSGPEDNQGNTGAGFTKNVLLMEFVSFDCVYCPAVTTAMNKASEKYPNRLDVISVHGRLDEDDPMEFDGYRQFQNFFYGVTGYPAVIIDQRDDLVTVGSFDEADPDFLERLNVSSPIGIAISTKVDNRTVTIETTVKNAGETSSNYRLAVAVLENNIAYRQADWVNEERTWIEDYKHYHVLREILSENYFGDPIADFASNSEYKKSFSYTIPEAYQKDNVMFVAYVVAASGFADRVSVNSRSVPIGKSVDLAGIVR